MGATPCWWRRPGRQWRKYGVPLPVVLGVFCNKSILKCDPKNLYVGNDAPLVASSWAVRAEIPGFLLGGCFL